MMLVKPVVVAAIETALKNYLALDADANLFLKPLAGKVIAFKLMPLEWVIYLCPTEESIQLLEHYPNEPDTVLTGSVGALAMMGLSANPMRAIFSGDITIEGDMETGKRFQRLFDQLDPDFEEALSHYTGDIVAHQAGQMIRSGHQWGQETLHSLQMNTTEFLQDETRDLPAQPEVDVFLRNVDELRSGLDRLDARIARLSQFLLDIDNS